jgi:hypothetical protein
MTSRIALMIQRVMNASSQAMPSVDAFEQTRQRLVAAGASHGAVDDLGAYHALWFSDPDGMRGELVLIVDSTLQGIHAPRPRH